MVDETPGADGVCPSCGAAAPSQLVEDARLALERARGCIQGLLRRTPVRDVTETLAEVDAAIRSIAKGVES